MTHKAVQIAQLQLRIPGLNREDGRRIGEEVAERVSRSLPAYGKKQRLGALDMRVKLPLGTPRDQIARMIAKSILEKLG